jgi:hypothetical protein
MLREELFRTFGKKVKRCRAAGTVVDLVSKKAKNCGRKRVDIDLLQVTNVSLNQRTTIRSLVGALNVSKTKMHKVFKEGQVRRHSSTLKTYLREQNKMEWLKFCTSMIDEQTVHYDPKFRDMHNIIHIDEKWFNGTKKNKTFYMLPSEDDLVRTVQNKNSIDKVMFLAAVARPRYAKEGNCYFDRKVGIWTFLRQVMSIFNHILST